jgi:beta-lactamase regulating signal transducer with metallopeptidase domain
MLQYLLNCSAIWLLSLLCYDIFFRRSTFHTYNRLYLLGTLLSGILIPLFSFENRQVYYEQVKANTVVENTIEAKKTIVTIAQATPDGQSINWVFWMLLIYGTGCLLSAAFILKDLIKIVRLRRKGTRIQSGQTNIILTGKEHSPFSFFGNIFLPDLERYNETQLQMIIAHEQRHNQLLHSMDVLIVQLCKIIFWFHPLPYVFLQRILMLHEYQADSVVDKPLPEYGAFLVEQSLLAHAPVLSNSFNRSPLKNRIVMLTRKSPTWSKSKILLAIPVLIISFLCFSKNAFSDFKRIKNGNKVSFRGNEFELKVYPEAKVQTQDPATGKMEEFTFEVVPYPIMLNNAPLLNTDSVDQKPATQKNINMHISEQFKQHNDLFAQLEDGTYTIDLMHFVTGKNGEVLYFRNDGMKNNQNIQLPGTEKWIQQKVNPANVKAKIDELMDNMAIDIKFTPAIKDGKAVPCFTEYGIGAPFYFTVKSHVAYEGKIAPGIHKLVHHGDNADTLEIMDVEFLAK